MMNGLDLFSGIGGLSLALSPWVRNITFCENNKFAISVLLSRMHDDLVSKAPIWDDVRTLAGTQFVHPVDIITAGFPCQDISVAGLGKGLDGERSGLVRHVFRLVEETQPRFIFLENVPAVRTRGLAAIVEALTSLRYDCRWTVLSAASVGAPHLRKRWFLLAHSSRVEVGQQSGRPSGKDRSSQTESGSDGDEKSLAHAKSDGRNKGWSESARLEGRFESSSSGHLVGHSLKPGSPRGTIEPTRRTISGALSERSGWWEVEPPVGRVVDGLPLRVDRLKCLGNAVVPAQARKAFKILMGLGD